MLRSRDFDLDFMFLRNPYIYVSSTSIPNILNIDERDYGKSLLLYVFECKTLRSIYSISLVFHNACFD